MIDLKINDTVLFVLNKKVETSVIFEQENDEGILEFFITKLCNIVIVAKPSTLVINFSIFCS